MLLSYSVDWRHESGCDRLDALTLAKKLAVLARIYALGLLNEDEYTKARNRIMQEHNVVTFEQV